ncbi:MAG: DUF533 domain-containing protein [Rhodobacter sp.]|jgi:hypothetical protein|nr:DUF533 domain-containing protein [Rhodobacter sp.]
MSLAKTLMKVVIGVAIVKGVSSLTTGGTDAAKPAPGRNTAPGRGTRIETGRKSNVPGGLDDLMDDVLRGGARGTTRSTDDDPLQRITRQKRSAPRNTAPKRGMEDLLEELTGASSRSAGRSQADAGLGGLLGSVLGGVTARSGGALRIEEEEEVSAALMLRAIIQAVKCDGALDADEKRKLMEAMGDASAAEVQAVNAELARPVDVDGLARMVPAGLEAQVYLASLSAIDLDQQAEAQYLHALAVALELAPHEVNALHDRAGAAHIYR